MEKETINNDTTDNNIIDIYGDIYKDGIEFINKDGIEFEYLGSNPVLEKIYVTHNYTDEHIETGILNLQKSSIVITREEMDDCIKNGVPIDSTYMPYKASKFRKQLVIGQL